MQDMIAEPARALVKGARAAAKSMQDAVKDKPSGSGVRMPVESFARVSAMLHVLADVVDERHKRSERYRATLVRIAELDIRLGRAALDDGAWKTVAAELQAIADGALAWSEAAPPAGLGRGAVVPPPVDGKTHGDTDR